MQSFPSSEPQSLKRNQPFFLSNSRKRWFLVSVVALALGIAINRQYYVDSLVLCRLHSLGAQVHFQTDPSWSAFFGGKVHQRIHVDFSGTGVGDDDLWWLGLLSDIQGLHLNETSITDRGLPRLIGFHDLTELELAHTTVTDDGLAILYHFPKLESLNLEAVRINGHGLRSLTGCRRLSRLNLKGTLLDDQGRFLAMRSEEFVTAAQLDGASDMRIILRYMAPSFASHIIASTTLAIPAMIISETSLSFLGLGLQPPLVSWGTLLKEAQSVRSVLQAPWQLWP